MGDDSIRRWFRSRDFGDDSLDLVELAMQAEEEFDIDIPDQDAEKIQTVDDAIRYLENRRGGPESKS